jgi:diguanylate cyclase (GGDEF)-like protein
MIFKTMTYLNPLPTITLTRSFSGNKNHSYRLVSRMSKRLLQQELQEEIAQVKQQNEILASENLFLKKQVNNLQQQVDQYRSQQKLLRQNNHELQRQANLDGLTQINNRRSFDEALEKHCHQEKTVSLLLIDIDYFKQYNDTYGHQAGDRCLIRVAQALVRVARRSDDVVARYGGEEFAIILPHTDPEGAMQIAELLQKEIQKLKIHHSQSLVSSEVTVSVGIATSTSEQQLSTSTLIRKADQALYNAKQEGRNRACQSPISR